ncbi:hypothetical protein Ppa06_41090 [Planomonospora parontospora subsp. parontospora]|uniref:Uncharacterized protein n=2 Tax=Planomonospora parontospora TaxID=58119 RepID=A0AA37BJ35_9ACTN|nr:hypothetical protein [Planomonospora parontospora]GGK78553.1 hypothetical protein GCM10010126_42430 [Planomonospora parontospora]GII10311.1 hypothetical protein Ppa06_41090 [Planomonospora parontospora subsp. parontospora]
MRPGSVTRAATVTDGVFAPGHLGEPTQRPPFELIDAVPADTGRHSHGDAGRRALGGAA